jgi:hypothetical protein
MFVLAFAWGVMIQPPAALPGVRLEALEQENAKGYRLYLSRDVAERVRLLLVETVDEEQIAKTLQARTDDLKVRLIILLAKRNVTQFKENLAKHNGPFGVEVTVIGPRWWDVAPSKRLTPEERAQLRERLELARRFMPRRARGVYDAFTTAPLSVKVRPHTPGF